MNKKYRIALFSSDNGENEFAVILSPEQDPKEFLDDGVTMDDIQELDGDFTSWPTDRELSK